MMAKYMRKFKKQMQEVPSPILSKEGSLDS